MKPLFFSSKGKKILKNFFFYQIQEEIDEFLSKLDIKPKQLETITIAGKKNLKI